MPALPKPPPCHQDWLAMQPTKNGRLCGQCEKEIYDFSAMSWQAIVQTQAAHGNALCGMYSPAQLKHWGQQPPSACAQLAAATTLALTLAAIPAPAQTVAARLVLRGTVAVAASASNAVPEPLYGVTVIVAGTNIGTATDMNGHYELAIPDTVSEALADTISFRYVGYKSSDWAVPPQSHGAIQHNVVLAVDPQVIAFSVQKPPSFMGRIRRRLRHPFSPRY